MCLFVHVKYLIVCAIKLNNNRIIKIVNVQLTLLNLTETAWSFNALTPG